MPQGAANPTIFAKAESGYEEQLRDLHSGVEGPPELAEVKGQCRSRTISAPTRETRYGMRSGMSELAWSSCRNTPDSTPSSRSPPSSKPCSERRERELRGISDACGKIPPAACASYLKKAGTRRAKSRIL